MATFRSSRDYGQVGKRELRNALEDWILFGLLNGYPMPPLDGIDLLAARKHVA